MDPLPPLPPPPPPDPHAPFYLGGYISHARIGKTTCSKLLRRIEFRDPIYRDAVILLFLGACSMPKNADWTTKALHEEGARQSLIMRRGMVRGL